MRLMFRVLIWSLAAVAALALGGAGLGYYLASRSLPDYGAAWSLAGPSAEIEIVRDAQAVPHIFAQTDADAFFALGWAHAQDRLWQMEIGRRTAHGRLAELFGPQALPVDLSMRALELPRLARAALDGLTPQTRALLDAYAAGVNARVRAVNARALGRGAPEFFLFAQEGLAPWTAADSLAMIKLMALRLTASARLEARRARLLAQIGPERLADLDPAHPDDGALALPAFSETFEGLSFPDERAEALPPASPLSPFAQPGRGGASNIWAVSGARASSGAPLLATDPHLWLSAPSVWMLARITSPGFNAIGGSVPGIPAILIGRNDGFGWGLSTTQVDDQDIFLQQRDPQNPSRYRTPEGWADFEIREETIRVAGREPTRIRLLRSRHGPVMPEGGELDFSAITPRGHVAALSWTALETQDRSIEAALGLMRARSVEEGAQAAQLHLAPAQNVVMADAEGVGIVVAGVAPLRRHDSRTQGRVPSLGWRAENDWDGMIAAEALPRALRPLSGAVANANNRVTNAPYPQNLSFDWAEPYRFRRIAQRLGDREFHSRESFMDMQSDAVSEMARSVLPLIARDLWWSEAAQTEDAAGLRRATALDLLRQWNGEMSAHDPEPLIFAAWMRALTRRLAEDELGALYPIIEGARPLFVERVFHDIEGAAQWCDVVKTPARETCADIARLALDDALATLTRAHGARLEGWRWGAAHVAEHVHAPLGLQRWLGMLVNISHESAGGDHTIMMGGTPGRGPDPHANIHAAGLRAVMDFADLDRSVYVIATGQSGHPLSRHYDDQGRLWRRGDYAPMSLDPEDARAGALGVTRLTPAQ